MARVYVAVLLEETKKLVCTVAGFSLGMAVMRARKTAKELTELSGKKHITDFDSGA